MPADSILKEGEHKMGKAVDVLHDELRAIRTGRATTALVDHVRVDYYGSPNPLNHIANVTAPEPQLIVIRPFDPSSLKEIEKALLQSDVGITPQNDGKFIRLTIPPLSEERRKQLSGQVKDMGEDAKVAIRNVRRDTNKAIDHEQKNASLPEDAAYKAKDKAQDLTTEYEKKVDDLISKKTEEIMTI